MVGITVGTTHSIIGTDRTDGATTIVGIIGTLHICGVGVCHTTTITTTITHTDLRITDLHSIDLHIHLMEALVAQDICTIVRA